MDAVLFARSALAQSLVSSGPWEWEGAAPLLFFREGRVFTPWGSGTWGLASQDIALSLGDCGAWRLRFAPDLSSFTATSLKGAITRGVLSAQSAPRSAVDPARQAAPIITSSSVVLLLLNKSTMVEKCRRWVSGDGSGGPRRVYDACPQGQGRSPAPGDVAGEV